MYVSIAFVAKELPRNMRFSSAKMKTKEQRLSEITQLCRVTGQYQDKENEDGNNEETKKEKEEDGQKGKKINKKHRPMNDDAMTM